MKNSRRIKRMGRSRRKLASISLTSMMDVFTILVFFLLVNSGQTELLQSPKDVTLPESVVESKPRETVVIMVSQEQVLVQGQPTVLIADILAMETQDIEPIAAQLANLQDRVIGVRTDAASRSKEVTILADKGVPFDVIRRIMSTCTGQGYTRISLAVTQTESERAKV
jgi:biopolymer transport protein ExbD